jgi:hypothetical protein
LGSCVAVCAGGVDGIYRTYRDSPSHPSTSP